MAISNCLFSPTSENPHVLTHATTHSRDRWAQYWLNRKLSIKFTIFVFKQKEDFINGN